MTKNLSGLLLFLFLVSFQKPSSLDYDIAAFYKGIVPAEGTKSLSSSDKLEDVELLLSPIDIDKGNYVLKIIRKGSNLYKVDDKNIYIETKYCYEYSYSQEVILKVDGSYGYTKGKIIF